MTNIFSKGLTPPTSIHGTCYLTSSMPSINSPTLSYRWWQVSHIFCGIFTRNLGEITVGWNHRGSSPSRITRPQRCGVLHPVRRRLRVNDVVDVVKMFLGFTGPRKGNPEIPNLFLKGNPGFGEFLFYNLARFVGSHSESGENGSDFNYMYLVDWIITYKNYMHLVSCWKNASHVFFCCWMIGNHSKPFPVTQLRNHKHYILSYFAVFRAESLMVYLIADLYH